MIDKAIPNLEEKYLLSRPMIGQIGECRHILIGQHHGDTFVACH
jgi:hypothetical protein